MKHIKKFLGLLMILLLVAVLFACEPSTNEEENPSDPEIVIHVVMVTFDLQDGNWLSPQSNTIEVEIGAPVERPADPERDGHVFAGWFTQADAGVLYNFDTPATVATTLFAQWAPTHTKVTVTFDWGFEGGLVNYVNIDIGQTVDVPTNPVRANHIFRHWAILGSTGPFNFATYIDVDITLVAIWESEFLITFNMLGDVPSGVQIPAPSYTVNFMMQAPAVAAVEGYYFAWQHANGDPVNFSVAFTSDTQVIGRWTKVQQHFTVTFNISIPAVDFTQEIKITIVEGGFIDAVDIPYIVQDGYKITGWTLSGSTDLINFNTFTVTQDTTLVAVVEEFSPTLNIDLLIELLANPVPRVNDFIPETMQANYNTIDSAFTFDTWQNVSAIPHGHGQTWNMVIDTLDNYEPLMVLFRTTALMADLIIPIVRYYATHDSDGNIIFTGGFRFLLVNYRFDLQILSDYVEITITAGSIQIFLSYNLVSQTRIGRAQLSDANALRFEATPISLTLAHRFLGVQRRYISLLNTGTEIQGRLVTHLGLDGTIINNRNAVDFFVVGNHLLVQGNHLTPLISVMTDRASFEVYNITNGQMLGWGIRETNIASVEYHTLWFNLADIVGLNNIRQVTVDEQLAFVVNNRTAVFEPRWNTAFLLRTSRRFDIEMRTKYYTIKDGDDYTRVAIQVPQLFVQIANIDTFSADVTNANSNLNLSLNNALTQYLSGVYDILARPANFVGLEMDAADILAWIGPKVEIE